MRRKSEIAEIEGEPVFSIPQFTKAAVYLLLFLGVLGPFIVPILLCFEPYAFLHNMAFVPMSNKIGTLIFFGSQMITWMLILCLLYIVWLDK